MITAAQFRPESSTADDAAAYAHLLLQLHELSLAGQDEGDEADALRDQMTFHWYRMSAKEQERMRWLSADLYTIEEGGAKAKEMSAQEKQTYQQDFQAAYESGDIDRLLECLRRPYPGVLPPDMIPFLQARAWDRLGNVEAAIVFMQEAERRDPCNGMFVMQYLHQLGRRDEAEAYARRFLENPQATAEQIYLASTIFLEGTRSLSDKEAAPILNWLIPPLKRALQAERASSHNGLASDPSIEGGIALHLGLCLERTGQLEQAIDVYSQAIGHMPMNHELYALLLTFRALAHWPPDTPAALRDFERAIRAGTTAVWPYYFLAVHLIRQEKYAEAVRLCNFTLENAVMPTPARAELYRFIAIAYAKLGQPSDWVLRNFDLADQLDPDNPATRADREWYEAMRTTQEEITSQPLNWPSRDEMLKKAWATISTRVERQQQQLSEQFSAERQAELVAAS